ncbi:MAG TPA: hypothetical protein ENK57_10785 [Polyangiaceae bacterium]|nr:hypothetical protein [Polyangiaceae bacterium]
MRFTLEATPKAMGVEGAALGKPRSLRLSCGGSGSFGLRLQRIAALLRDRQHAIHEGTFWTRIGSKDPQVSYQMRKLWEHGYKATVWPLVLPGKGHMRRGPSIVEAKVAARYRVSGDEARRAWEQTALSVVAKKIAAISEDAELKGHVELRREATRAQLELQRTTDAAELRRLEEQAVAEDQSDREALEAFQVQMAEGLRAGAGLLVETGPQRKPRQRRWGRWR